MSLFTTLIPSLSRSATAGSAQETREAVTPSIRPVFDIAETADGYGLTVQLPGVSKAGLSIADENGVLTIRGERAWKRPAGCTQLYRETSDTPFELSLRHDNGIDAEKVVAELSDGVLRASLPKAEARKPRKIAVN